jgi:hypothetical protein
MDNLRMNEERILKKVLNKKVERKCSRGRPQSRWTQHVRRDVTQSEGRPWKEVEEDDL